MWREARTLGVVFGLFSSRHRNGAFMSMQDHFTPQKGSTEHDNGGRERGGTHPAFCMAILVSYPVYTATPMHQSVFRSWHSYSTDKHKCSVKAQRGKTSTNKFKKESHKPARSNSLLSTIRDSALDAGHCRSHQTGAGTCWEPRTRCSLRWDK